MKRKADKRAENAYLTVYLTLFLTVLLTLFLVLLKGARGSGAALEAACATDIGVQNILAEYHQELLHQYNLFAIDSSYGTSECTKKNVEVRLRQYIEGNLELSGRDFLALRVSGAEVTGVSVLTDETGAVFRRRAIEAVRDDVGIELFYQLQGWVDIVEINGLESAQTENEKEALDREIEEYTPEEDTTEKKDKNQTAEKIENPTDTLNEMRKKGILKLVLAESQTLSGKSFSKEESIGERLKQGKVTRGNMDTDVADGLIEKFFFQEYLLRYMGRWGQEKEAGGLSYQLEYILAGKETDRENLEKVALRLCVLREAANVAYLYTDAEKSQEAEALATTICSLCLVPELTPVLHSTIILGWAYAESLCDIRTLFEGGKVPLLKDTDSWQLGLGEALAGGISGKKNEKGLSYEDYLRVFLFLSDMDTMTVRAMDMVETDIRRTTGNGNFRLDGCYDKIQTKVNVTGSFGESFELIREKEY